MAFEELQDRVEGSPEFILSGLATTSAITSEPDWLGITVTVFEELALPPGPVQDRVKVVVAFSAPVDSCGKELFVGLEPVQLKLRGFALAVQDVTAVLVQDKVEDPPENTVLGEAISETVGASF